MNKDGGWEKVVALDNDLDNRNSSRGSYVNAEDMNKRLNWSKQMQPDEEVQWVLCTAKGVTVCVCVCLCVCVYERVCMYVCVCVCVYHHRIESC